MTETTVMTAPDPKSAIVEFANWRTRHERFQNAVVEIGHTHAMHGTGGAGMLLMGMPGLGKSSILASYIKHHLRARDDLETVDGSKEPIILVSVPAEPTLKTMIQEIILASGYQGSIKGTIGELKQKLDELIVQRGVEMLVIDEFQHFLREQAKSNTRGVVNHIKLLMDKHKLAVIMAGTPPGYRSIAQFEELYQRFAHRQIRLKPFRIDSPEELQVFGNYVNACAQFLHRHDIKTIRLANDKMLFRLFLATKGIPRLISHLLMTAIEGAEPGSRITMDDLSRAFGRSSLNPELDSFDPFKAPMEKVAERATIAQKKAIKQDSEQWKVKA